MLNIEQQVRLKQPVIEGTIIQRRFADDDSNKILYLVRGEFGERFFTEEDLEVVES